MTECFSASQGWCFLCARTPNNVTLTACEWSCRPRFLTVSVSVWDIVVLFLHSHLLRREVHCWLVLLWSAFSSNSQFDQSSARASPTTRRALLVCGVVERVFVVFAARPMCRTWLVLSLRSHPPRLDSGVVQRVSQ